MNCLSETERRTFEFMTSTKAALQ